MEMRIPKSIIKNRTPISYVVLEVEHCDGNFLHATLLPVQKRYEPKEAFSLLPV